MNIKKDENPTEYKKIIIKAITQLLCCDDSSILKFNTNNAGIEIYSASSKMISDQLQLIEVEYKRNDIKYVIYRELIDHVSNTFTKTYFKEGV